MKPFRTAAVVGLLALVGCKPADRPHPDTVTDGARHGWLLGAQPGDDLIRAGDDEAALRARFGGANVLDATIPVGEGMFEPATLINPEDPGRRLAVQWEDPELRTRPTLVRIASDGPSEWAAYPGATIGTSLEELEEMNGGPFHLHGLGWDYEGTVSDWRGGRLGMLWGNHVILRLHPRTRDRRELERRVLGDGTYPSTDPAMRELEMVVYDLIVRPR